MNIVYSEKKWKCLFKEKINSVYSGKKWIVFIPGRNE